MSTTATQSFAKILEPGESAKLLSLDGGGVKGISSLVILQAIMEAVKTAEKSKGISSSQNERLPRDYFHLAAGTSTGGLIALMLFRLNMSTSQAITAYEDMASKIFMPTFFGIPLHWAGPVGYYFGNGWLKLKALFLPASFSDKPLKMAIDDIVAKYGRPNDQQMKGEAVLLDENAGRMFMCTTLTERGESILMRSYKMPADATPVSDDAKEAAQNGLLEQMSISVAARATSAAPTYLPEVKYGTSPILTFWDGGLLNNNPINQLWRARYDLVNHKDPAPAVSCVLSLGTSWSSATSWSPFRLVNTVTTAAAFLTNTESKHVDFKRFMNRMVGRPGSGENAKYFRFNAPTGKETFNMDDYKSMHRLKKITEIWVKTPEIDAKIIECAESLLRK